MNNNNFEASESNFRRFSIVSREKNSPLQWEEIKELSDKVYSSHHALVSINEHLFVHGGIKIENSLKPTNEFFKVDMKTYRFDDLTTPDSPFLSQHAAVVFSNRYIVLIGGWDGHTRTSAIYIFDALNLKWLNPPIVEGFPKGAGLSSHTANAALKSSSGLPGILIIGREGSTRIQRRYGNAFQLTCNASLSKFTYSDIPLNVDSRSGHCTSIINSKIFIVGGRDDKVIDIHVIKGLNSDKTCDAVSTLIQRVSEFQFEKCPLVGRRKAGRRGHCLVPAKHGFMVSGGSSFIEASHVADCAGFLYVTSSNCEEYFFLGSLSNTRTDGACSITDDQEAIYHGGIDVQGKIRSEFLKLKLVH